MDLILSLSGDTTASHAALVDLQSNLLPATYHGRPIADTLEILESHLVGRRPTVNAAMATAGATTQSVVQSVLKEHLALSAGAPGGASAALGAGSAAVDKDGQATTLANFKALEAQMPGYNLLTEAGRRDALTAALAPGVVVIATRVLFREYSVEKSDKGHADRMVARNETLCTISGLRPHLHEYFNWFMRYDPATAAVDPRLLKYEFATLSKRRLLDQLTSLALDQIDLIAAPGGMLGYFYWRDALPRPRKIDPRDYYCNVATVTELSEFAGKLLSAFGPPTTLPAGASGYTFTSFCGFYIETLKLAARLPLLQEQYEHLAACDGFFRAALICMRVTLQAVINHADVGSQTLQVALIADDADPIAGLKRLAVDVDDKARARANLGALLPTTTGAAHAVDFNNLRLSDTAWTKQSTAAKKRKVGAGADYSQSSYSGDDGLFDPFTAALEEDDFEAEPSPRAVGGGGNPLPPGSLSRSWKWLDQAKRKLVISGRVWNITELAKHLGCAASGVDAPCWPYVLCLCEDKNRPSRCPAWNAKDHGTENGKPHAWLAKIDAHALKESHSRAATVEEKKGISTDVDWAKRGGKGRGDGRGRGRRARGRQGGSHFRRPSHP